MLYYIAQYITDRLSGTEWEPTFSWLRLFKYITFRGAGAAITALLLSWWFGPRVIEWLKELKIRHEFQPDDVGTAGYVDPRKNLEKLGTPTMGGLMIVVIIDLTTLVWAQWSKLVLLTLFTIVLLCMLGFIDDFLKLKYRNTEGVRGFIKLYVQGALTLFAAFYLLFNKDTHNLISEVMIPFIKEPVLVGTTGAIVGVILTIFVIVGTSNAVNLTDGMDGLAIGCHNCYIRFSCYHLCLRQCYFCQILTSPVCSRLRRTYCVLFCINWRRAWFFMV